MTYDSERLVARVVRSLEREPTTSLKALARLCGVSRHTLARAIKSATALSFRQLRDQRRQARALELLGGNPSRSIKESAYALGFARPRSFTRWLKRAAGCTPVRLRRELGKHPTDSSGQGSDSC